MALTDLGFPFPDSLDSENNPPADIKLLAEAINDYLKAKAPRTGLVTGSPSAGNAVDVNVLFTPEFPPGVIPRVALGVNHAYVDSVAASYVNLTHAGMTVRVYSRVADAPGAAVTYVAIRP